MSLRKLRFSADNFFKLISQIELNKIPRNDLVSIEQKEMNSLRRRVAISNSKFAAYPLEDPLTEITIDEMEKSQPNKHAKGGTFACYGADLLNCAEVTVCERTSS